MPPPTADSPRKARKSLRSVMPPTNSTTTQSASNNVSQRKKARKSTGTRKAAAQFDSGSSEDELRPRRASNRTTSNISQNTTVPFSQGRSRDSDSSDSEVAVRRKTVNRRPATSSRIFSQLSTSGTSQANKSSSDSENKVRRKNQRKNAVPSESSLESSDSDINARKKARGRQNQVSSTKNSAAKRIDPRNDKVEVIKKKTAALNIIFDDSDEETVFSTTSVTGGTLKTLVNKCVHYILVADQKKHAIKKQDIIIHVFEKSNQKMYPAVMSEACDVLKKTFGLEILKNKDQKSYLLVNILDRDLEVHEFVEHSPLELQKQGLIFYLLTIIYMNENAIPEQDLWKALEPLGIFATSRTPHPIFGDVKKYVTVELVKQMYLEHKLVNKDPPQYEFLWGERAVQEVGKKQLLNFACKIMTDTKPEDWVYQYNDAKENATEEA